MKKVTLNESKTIYGFRTRTKNANEMSSETARIAPLWKSFNESVDVDYQSGSGVYGAYFDYASDHAGEFSVLAGTDQADIADTTGKLESVSLPAGDYLLFEGEGEMPQAVIDTWGEVWAYFANNEAEYQRAYSVDFECYKSQNDIEIYIAVNS